MITIARPAPTAGVELATAALAQLVMLAGLAAGAGTGAVGLLAGAAYAAALLALLGKAMRAARRQALGPADVVTLARALLVGAVTALVVEGMVTGTTPVLVLVAVASVALALDAVDGKVARRSGTVSSLGARFDMEVDAFLVLVLSVHVALSLGPWVLAIGLMRYLFVAASWVFPWLRGSLPPNYAAKTVAALQGIVLVVAASQLLTPPWTAVLVGAALAALCWSFGRDVRRLWLRTALRAAG
ncbi:CDP-alcohol phosphatidyltransferase family protein [Pseudonocardia sp. TRM90224]|uniref:CDP-alcohol phosphatidyltransferase family protein n=1 Tax=Pseudonocardia sp. TRM90224 TaxID=2812678 RepID=UPI001E47A04C|nr:CDP-alcohol phosphatidyltransferase family protein [Pseudonocardia sp. TRM90224]